MDADSWNEAEVNFFRRPKLCRRDYLDYLKIEQNLEIWPFFNSLLEIWVLENVQKLIRLPALASTQRRRNTPRFRILLLGKENVKTFFYRCSNSGRNESTPQTQSNVSWISSKAELEISFMKTCLEMWVWESGPKIDPATGVRVDLSPLKEIHDILLGSKREDRFSNPFFVNWYKIRVNLCKGPRTLRKFPQKCQKIAGCWGRAVYVCNLRSPRNLARPLRNVPVQTIHESTMVWRNVPL